MKLNGHVGRANLGEPYIGSVSEGSEEKGSGKTIRLWVGKIRKSEIVREILMRQLVDRNRKQRSVNNVSTIT